MDIVKIIKTNWRQIIKQETNKTYFKNLISLLEKDYKNFNVYPCKENILKCFTYFNIEDLKVILIGQDPYHNKMQATGLAFSVPQNFFLLPSSLKNLFYELKNDLRIERKNGDLSDWAQQGVLLLNRILTVIENKPKSHKNIGWEIFTLNIIKFIDQNCTGVVFILLGSEAKKITKYILNNKKNIISAIHPSGLSAYKGFFGSKIFSKANQLLTINNKKIIQW